MLGWIVGSLALATLAWFAIRPVLADSARDWNQPTLPPSRAAAPADELMSWIDDGVCPQCGSISLAGAESPVTAPDGTAGRRIVADCEECDFYRVIETTGPPE